MAKGERNRVYNKRTALLINKDNSVLEQILSQNNNNIAINYSEKLIEELRTFNRIEYATLSKGYLSAVKENNTYFSISLDLADDSKTTFIKLKKNNRQISILCVDNLIDKDTYREQIRNSNSYDFSDFVDFLNEQQITTTIARSYYKRLKDSSKEQTVYRLQHRERNISEETKRLLVYSNYKYGYLLTKEKYYTDNTVYSYDINSAYPYALKTLGLVTFAIPITESILNTDKKYSKNMYHYFGTINITNGKLKENKLPFQFMSNTKVFNRLFRDKVEIFTDFNKSNYIGLITDIELNELEESYDNLEYTLSDIYRVYIDTPKELVTFIDDLYKQKSELSGLKKQVIKSGVNSMIGKLSPDDNKENYILKVSHLFLLSYIRNYLRTVGNEILSKGYKFIGCDTDSIKTNMPIDEFNKIARYGNKLGQFKVEHTFTNFYQSKTKQYCGIENNELVIVCAGDKEVNQIPLIEDYRKEILCNEEQNRMGCISHSNIGRIIILDRWLRSNSESFRNSNDIRYDNRNTFSDNKQKVIVGKMLSRNSKESMLSSLSYCW
jgi:hypothetical protein